MFASVSIDLDGLDCYHAIHGLSPTSGADPIYEVALERYLGLLDDLGMRSTLFVITADLDREATATGLLGAFSDGHEIASHTHDHPYDFGRLDAEQVAAQIDRADRRILEVFGKRPVGFRAPGYSVSRTVLELLESRQYRYDSSVFPCPPYYFAKAAVMAGLYAVGRPSKSALTNPWALLAPLQPYRPDRHRFHRPARESGSALRLWEIPMCVAPFVRLPVIGTTLALFGSRAFRRIYPRLRRSQPFINLEFHGIDFLDADDPGVSAALVESQPDLRRPLADKFRSYRDVLRLIQFDYEFGTLAQMVDRLREKA